MATPNVSIKADSIEAEQDAGSYRLNAQTGVLWIWLYGPPFFLLGKINHGRGEDSLLVPINRGTTDWCIVLRFSLPPSLDRSINQLNDPVG